MFDARNRDAVQVTKAYLRFISISDGPRSPLRSPQRRPVVISNVLRYLRSSSNGLSMSLGLPIVV